MKTPPQVYSCAKCGAQAPKWAGRCTECGTWGSLALETAPAAASSASAPEARLPGKASAPQSFAELSQQMGAATFLPTGFAPWDEMLGGGVVSGSVTLLGGEPGIGKSTLLSQLCLGLAVRGKRVLYVTGEESPTQVSLRLRRLMPEMPPTLVYVDITDAPSVAATLSEVRPDLTIIDSIQTLRTPGVSGEAGNVSQVKASCAIVTEAAKKSGVPVILVGQVTKEGDLAGPRLVEHLVDTVLMLEGDRDQSYRLLRPLKHRFGSADGFVLFQMTERGLEEVADPSAALLAHRPKTAAGSSVTCLLEGSRPLLMEIQALVTPAGYSTPLRRANGIDSNRLSMLLAVMAKRAGLKFADQDVFVNVVGGLDAREPAADLAICLALASAKSDVPVPAQVCAFGEVGLAGEIRPVTQAERRMREAMRHGCSDMIAPPADGFAPPKEANPLPCSTLREALGTLGLLEVKRRA